MIFKHDCNECFFIMTIRNKDYYYCEDSLIIRLSDKPEDNKSYPFVFAIENIVDDIERKLILECLDKADKNFRNSYNIIF